jgi:hypothetical protein
MNIERVNFGGNNLALCAGNNASVLSIYSGVLRISINV